MKRLRFLIFLLMSVVLVGCTFNQPPVIQSLNIKKEIIYSGDRVEIECSATDPEGDQLTYQWNFSHGQVSGSGSTVIWTAPNELAEVAIGIVVSDGKKSAIKKRTIKVLQKNNLEVELIASDDSVHLGEKVELSALVSDLNKDDFTYRWEASGGILEQDEDESLSSWYANQEGIYEISVYVNDGRDELEATISIEVINIAPSIEINCDQQYIEAGEIVFFDIIITDDLPSSVEIQQIQASGGVITLLSNSGPTARYSWAAPSEPGSYKIEVTVWDQTEVVFAEINIEVFKKGETYLNILGQSAVQIGTATMYTFQVGGLEGDLNYRWEVSGGIIEESEISSDQMIWNAPMQSGEYTIIGYVSNDDGVTELSISKTVAVFDQAPQITYGFREQLDLIVADGEMIFEVAVRDDESTSVNIDVVVDCGNLVKLETGNLYAYYKWTVPSKSGRYYFTITVSDLNNTIIESFTVDVINKPPVINEISLSQATVKVGNPIILQADMSYSNLGELTYEWHFSGGELIRGSGDSLCEWLAPLTTGYVTATLTVSDEYNSVSKEVQIEVIDNHIPVIKRLIGIDRTTVGKIDNFFRVVVEDPDKNDELIYRWEINGGEIISGQGTGQIKWQAPKSIGDYTVTFYVSDDGGLTEISDTIVVSVVPPEHSFNFNYHRNTVKNGEVVFVQLSIADSDYSKVNFDISASAGTLTESNIGCKYAHYYWRAPSEEGLVIFTVTWSTEGYSFTEEYIVTVVKNDPPLIESIRVDGNLLDSYNLKVAPGNSLNFRLEITDHENDSYTVTWNFEDLYNRNRESLNGENIIWTAPLERSVIYVYFKIEDETGSTSTRSFGILVDDGSQETTGPSILQEIDALIDTTSLLFETENLSMLENYFHSEKDFILRTKIKDIFDVLSFEQWKSVRRDLVHYDSLNDLYLTYVFYECELGIGNIANTRSTDRVKGVYIVPVSFKRDFDGKFKLHTFDFFGNQL